MTSTSKTWLQFDLYLQTYWYAGFDLDWLLDEVVRSAWKWDARICTPARYVPWATHSSTNIGLAFPGPREIMQGEWCHQHKVESEDMFKFNVRPGIHDQFMMLAFHALSGLRFEYFHVFSTGISERCSAPKVCRDQDAPLEGDKGRLPQLSLQHWLSAHTPGRSSYLLILLCFWFKLLVFLQLHGQVLPSMSINKVGFLLSCLRGLSTLRHISFARRS